MRHQIGHHSDAVDRIAGIAQSTEAASIGLISAIDGTVDAMTGIAQVMAGMSKLVGAAYDEVMSADVQEGTYIDPDDVAIDTIHRAEVQFGEFLRKLVLKRSAIDRDCELKDHHCEALHSAYESARIITPLS